jgi:putative nucleotidyltransferase with HDIG domain
LGLHEALRPPLDVGELLETVPELALSRGVEQSSYHHLDTFEHTLEVVRGVERELGEERLGASVRRKRVDGLRLAAALHDVAKPVTRGEHEGRVLFVSHDSLGARLVRRVCRRLELSALLTDLAATLTALHLKIGFMHHDRADYPPERLVRAAGPFGEELAVLSLADRLAAQGPRLKPGHVKRHEALCAGFLNESRALGPHPDPAYEGLSGRLSRSGPAHPADVGYAASRLRLLVARGMDREKAIAEALRLL